MTAWPQHNASDAEWNDWRWQMRHRISDVETLERYVQPTPGEREAIEATADVFRWTITPYYASLMDPVDPACPIRQHVVPQAAEVLREVVKTFKPHDIAVSSYGVREGVLYEQMPQRLRDRDPLIEACRFAEYKDARLPGFGQEIYRFILPLFKSAKPERLRLIQAACLLHDVSWRAHPDYRAEVCFDNATRANLGGLKHSERVYLGLALLHRYSNKREGSRFASLERLISQPELLEAEVLGKAMRFAAMLWLKCQAPQGELRWFPKKKVIELHLSAEAAPLFGEVAQARFDSLALTLGASKVIKAPA